MNRRIVATGEMLVLVPSGHPWSKRRRPVTAATRLVHREPASGTRTTLENALAAFAPPATPLLELSSTSAVRSAVYAGAGPAVINSLAVRDDLSSGRLVQVEVEGVDLTRALRAIWPAGQRPVGTARDLLAIPRRG